MPGMSGLELLPQARAARPDVTIIMIAAYGDAETKRKALENGAEALLTKPIDFATSAMRSTCGLNASHERMGCGITITNGLDRVRPMACPFGRACRIDVSGCGPGLSPVMDIRRLATSTCVTVR